MIRKKTVVVVGAGASFDLGFPLGKDLKVKIADVLGSKNMDGGRAPYVRSNEIQACIDQLARQHGKRARELVRIANFISDQMPKAASIDNFMDAHRENRPLNDIGKLAIAFVIAKKEFDSAISRNGTRNGRALFTEDYFVTQLMRLVSEGHNREELSKSFGNLAFVIFNSDRCVEASIDRWVREYFGEDSRDLVRGIQFLHPYGSLGDFFQGTNTQNLQDRSSALLNPVSELMQMKDSIRTFTEQKDTEMLSAISEVLTEAKSIIFLGFAYGPQNMEMLDVPSRQVRRVFGTGYGFSDEDLEEIVNTRLAKFTVAELRASVVKCTSAELFDKRSISISSAVGAV